MTDYLQRAVVLTLIALTAGCASMSENQCRTANWREQGEADGLIGQQARIDQYAYQCRQFGVQPAEAEYLAGWSDGYWEHYHRASGSKM
ncbi:MAG TPA: DUF2799 domain-containing protein [Burkholderiales bacterium]|nr:DUF2799 domain-containing protein [Burkholderiales bacterium]